MPLARIWCIAWVPDSYENFTTVIVKEQQSLLKALLSHATQVSIDLGRRVSIQQRLIRLGLSILNRLNLS